MIAGFLERVLILSVRLLAGAQARWQGCCPTPDQRIYIANHSSHLDFLLLSSALPASLRLRARPVAATEYWTSGPVRRYLIQNVFRCVLLGRERFQLNPLEPLAVALRQGDSLIFFPEGTRGPGDTLQPLKPGIFHLARWFPEIDIVPVWIDNSYRILPRGFAIPVPLITSVIFGPPLRGKESQSQDQFLTQVRESLEALRPRWRS
jgi:1-acyl-sn-glycerol-3-phosphate acyltransferase